MNQTKGFGRQNRQKMSLGHLFSSDELISLCRLGIPRENDRHALR